MINMKKIFSPHIYQHLIAALFAGALFISAPTKYTKAKFTNGPAHIVFIEDSFDEALKQGKLQNKYIFVDAYATWCGPCKMLKARTFTDEKAADFFNANFVNVSIDMEKGQGPQLAAKWGMTAYPTLIIFNPQGKPVLGTVGYIKPNELIKFGQQGLASK
jgi:thiol:disulfide interchange protein